MEAVGTSRKLFELLDRQPVIQNDGFMVSNNLVGKIEFRNVKFNYPSRPDIQVLQVHFKNFTLNIFTGPFFYSRTWRICGFGWTKWRRYYF